MNVSRYIAQKLIVIVLIISLTLCILYAVGLIINVSPSLSAIKQYIILSKLTNNKGKQSIEYSINLDKLADIYFESKQYRRSIKARKKALSNFVNFNLTKTSSYADCLFKHLKNNNNKTGIEYTNQIHTCRRLYNKLYDNDELNDYSKRNYIDVILEIANDYNFSVNDTNYFNEINYVQKSFNAYNSIRNKKTEDRIRNILSHNTLGLLLTEDYKMWLRAQQHFEKALKFSAELTDENGFNFFRILICFSYTRLLNKMTDYGSSKKLLEQCDKKSLKKYNLLKEYYKLQYDVLLGLGEYDLAIKANEKLATLNYKNDKTFLFNSLVNMSLININKGNQIKSAYYLFRLKLLLKSNFKNDKRLFAYYILKSRFHLRFGSQLETYKWIKMAHSVCDTNSSDYISLLKIESLLSKRENHHEYLSLSNKIFSLTVNHITNHFGFLTEEQRTSYWNNFDEIISSLYEAGYYNKNQTQTGGICYNAALFSKGIILNSSIELSKIIKESKDSNLINDMHEMFFIQSKIRELSINTIDLDSLKNEVKGIERNIIHNSKKFGDFTRNMKIQWNNIKTSLKTNDAAIEFISFINDKDIRQYAALVITSELKEPKYVSICTENELDDLTSKKSISEIYTSQNAQKLFNLIWKPLIELIGTKENIYFSPTNTLHTIALEHLPNSDGKLISDKFEMNRLSSTREIYIKEGHREENRNIVLFGGIDYNSQPTQNINTKQKSNKILRSAKQLIWDSLPGTKDEVLFIDSIFRNTNLNSKLYTGKTGSEETFKNLSGQSNFIIHIATHGFYLPLHRAKRIPFINIEPTSSVQENALDRSGLLFAGANTVWTGETPLKDINDGVLTAREISVLNFSNTDLIVLSACETGLGEISDEGVFGLQSSLKKAGVKSLLMTLWQIDDNATKDFMNFFYVSLIESNNKRKSFEKAKKLLRSNKKYTDSYYWAAFILVD